GVEIPQISPLLPPTMPAGFTFEPVCETSSAQSALVPQLQIDAMQELTSMTDLVGAALLAAHGFAGSRQSDADPCQPVHPELYTLPVLGPSAGSLELASSDRMAELPSKVVTTTTVDMIRTEPVLEAASGPSIPDAVQPSSAIGQLAPDMSKVTFP